MAAFLAGPLLLHLAETVGGDPITGLHTATWIAFGLPLGGAVVVLTVFVLGHLAPAEAPDRAVGQRRPGGDRARTRCSRRRVVCRGRSRCGRPGRRRLFGPRSWRSARASPCWAGGSDCHEGGGSFGAVGVPGARSSSGRSAAWGRGFPLKASILEALSRDVCIGWPLSRTAWSVSISSGGLGLGGKAIEYRARSGRIRLHRGVYAVGRREAPSARGRFRAAVFAIDRSVLGFQPCGIVGLHARDRGAGGCGGARATVARRRGSGCTQRDISRPETCSAAQGSR